MTIYGEYIDQWYKRRTLREKGWIFLLGCAFIYAILNFLFFSSIDDEKKTLMNQIRSNNNHIKSWNTQISNLKKITESPSYIKWLTYQKSLSSLHRKYKGLILPTSTEKRDDIIKTVLANTNAMQIQGIKYFPATLFSKLTVDNTLTEIYQQRITVTMTGSYFETIKYLQSIENAIPIAQWDQLTYTVTDYPNADIDMEFVLLYEKKP